MSLKTLWGRVVAMLASEDQRDLGDYAAGPVLAELLTPSDAEVDTAPVVEQAHEHVVERPQARA